MWRTRLWTLALERQERQQQEADFEQQIKQAWNDRSAAEELVARQSAELLSTSSAGALPSATAAASTSPSATRLRVSAQLAQPSRSAAGRRFPRRSRFGSGAARSAK